MKDTGTHHHGPLAGISAGAAVALVAGVLMLATARRQMSEVATVVAWVLMAVVVGAAIAGMVFLFLWLRHRVRHPELLARQQVIRAEVLDQAGAPQAITAVPGPAAIEPPRVYLTDAQFAALMVTNPQLPRDDQDRRSG